MGMVIIHVKSQPARSLQPRSPRPRKSRSRRRRERASRLAAWFMDLQDSFGDCARG